MDGAENPGALLVPYTCILINFNTLTTSLHSLPTGLTTVHFLQLAAAAGEYSIKLGTSCLVCEMLIQQLQCDIFAARHGLVVHLQCNTYLEKVLSLALLEHRLVCW